METHFNKDITCFVGSGGGGAVFNEENRNMTKGLVQLSTLYTWK